ncbi:hypothetical protein L7F22_059833 [Adiantum nelumboides]|nr:hypothetical protein [Adiantum nelumboides]
MSQPPMSPRNTPGYPYEDASMHPDFFSHTGAMEQMFQAVSNMLVQVSHTNQALLSYLSSSTNHPQRLDSKIRPKPFAGLSTEDVLTWLDHFDNVASYHHWSEERKAMEARTVLEGVAATWFIQQSDEVKGNWHLLK